MSARMRHRVTIANADEATIVVVDVTAEQMMLLDHLARRFREAAGRSIFTVEPHSVRES